jgi:hypothetical protein
MSQQRVRGFELAHLQRMEVALLGLGAPDAGFEHMGPPPSAAVSARYEAWRRDGRAVLRRLEDDASEAAATAELRTQACVFFLFPTRSLSHAVVFAHGRLSSVQPRFWSGCARRRLPSPR